MFVYILASKQRGTLYIGMTNDLIRRVYEHKAGHVDGFTKWHNIKSLIHYEQYLDAETAIKREKQLKKWNRAWKIRLIELHNPEWVDLYDSLQG